MKKLLISAMLLPSLAFATKGYYQTTETDQRVNFLLGIPKIAEKETSQYDKVDNELDTHLRSSLSNFRISFKFDGIPGIKKENILGFAAAGGYTHEKGWESRLSMVSKNY